MNLFQVLLNIHDYKDDETVYVVEPWSLESETKVITEPYHGLIQVQHDQLIFEYFLEVALIKTIFATLESHNVCIQEQCQRIIEYAIKNA